MKYKNFGNKKSADICETNPCVMGLKYKSELRSARTNPFHEWLEDVAVVGCPKKSKSPNFGMPLTPVVFIG